MATLVSKSESKKYLIFLNISFLSLVVCFFIIVHFYSPESLIVNSYNRSNRSSQPDCKGLASLDDYKSKCFYLKSNQPCVSQGYIDYVYLFYCTFGRFPHLCYFLLFLWLLVLFYVLGNTASEYFCSSLESLSKLLKLSPTIAGVTLLSFGNGAPDVFASIVSFMGNETSNVGLNTVLGGASFISCVVVGVISITMHPRHIRVNKSDFVRDICFFLLVLVWLLVILSIGEIDIWGAMGFSFLYVVYVCAVYVSHSRWKKGGNDPEIDASSSFGGELSTPILYGIEKVEVICIEDGALLGDSGVEEINKRCFWLSSSASCGMFLCILQMPLYLPRRLTIPVVCEERWSKPFAVTSVTLAPLLLAVLWNSQMENLTSKASLVIYGVGLLFGTVLGVLTIFTTDKSNPPKKCLLAWLAAGFLMSITWSYITAQELVGLLVSLGFINGVSPSILGLTLLAWGNSLGDLITNTTMALNGKPEGVQVAISGCYAGPIFNTVVGLGLSFVGSAWYGYPSAVVIPKDPYLLETVGLLMGSLIWALVILLRRDMRLDVVLGGGLLAVYLLSISLRLIQTVGSLQHHHITPAP